MIGIVERVRRDRGAQLCVFVWLIAAIAFALHRVPYDDEWFSITLARDTSPQAFWRSLADDVHPPYVALLDRATIAIAHAPWAMTLVHATASALALMLLTSIAPAFGCSPWMICIAALHPIVFMYGAASRWYPLAFLADALRAWSLFAPARRAGPKKRAAAFIAGATLGVAAGYAEIVLVTIDGLWWLAKADRARTRESKPIAPSIVVALLAAAGAVATLVASPVFATHVHTTLTQSKPLAARTAPLLFFGLGLVGEAHLPPPWTLLALVAIPGYVAIASRARALPNVAWLVSVVLGWFLATAIGASHPRYGLMLWTLLTARVLELASDAKSPRILRALAVATCGWLVVAMGLTLGERSFLKSDLNAMGDDGCASILASHADVIVAPYPRTATQIESVCHPASRVVTAGWVRHFDGGSPALMADIDAAIRGVRDVTLVTVPTGGSSLSVTNARTAALLKSRCTELSNARAVPDPFASFKRADVADLVRRGRYEITRYRCAP